MRWTTHVACIRPATGAHKVLVGNPEEKKQIGRLRLQWEDNIKIGLSYCVMV
jgi:hypothetical protein